MMRHIVVALVVLLFGLVFARLIGGYVELSELRPLAARYVTEAPVDLGTPNIITGILITYRGFDTLGEVAVLFMVAASIGLLLKKDDGKAAPAAAAVKAAPGKRASANTPAAKAAAARAASAAANRAALAKVASDPTAPDRADSEPTDEAQASEPSEMCCCR
jgi:hypothetical protein